MNSNPINRSRTNGFSLLELLLALSLTAFIGVALVAMFFQIYKNTRVWQEKENALNHARMVTMLILPLLQQAGVHGCRRLEEHNIFNLSEDEDYNITKPIHIIHQENTDDSLGIISLGVSQLVLNMAENYIITGNVNSLKSKDIIFIADCLHGEVHQVREVKKVGNLVQLILIHNIMQPFSNIVQIYPVYFDQFYLKKGSLFRLRKSMPAQEVISSVSDMRVGNSAHTISISWEFSTILPWSVKVNIPYG